MNKKHIGSLFDDFLEEENLLSEVTEKVQEPVRIEVPTLKGLICPQDKKQCGFSELPEKLFVLGYVNTSVDSDGCMNIDMKIVEYELKK